MARLSLLGMVRSSALSAWDAQWLRFSPLGELLSFASPKESNQRKGDPTSLPCGSPIWRARAGAPPTRPGTGHKTPRAAELGHGSAFPPPTHAKSAALKGSTPGCRLHVLPTASQALARGGGAGGGRRGARPPGGGGGGGGGRRGGARGGGPAGAGPSPAA